MPKVFIPGLGPVEFTVAEIKEYQQLNGPPQDQANQKARVRSTEQAAEDNETSRHRSGRLSGREAAVLECVGQVARRPRQIIKGISALAEEGETRRNIAIMYSPNNHFEVSRALSSLRWVAGEAKVEEEQLFRREREGKEVRIFAGPLLRQISEHIEVDSDQGDDE